MGEHKCYIEPINDEDRKPSDAARSSKRRQRRVARALRFLQANDVDDEKETGEEEERLAFSLFYVYSRVPRKPNCDTHKHFCLIFGNILIY